MRRARLLRLRSQRSSPTRSSTGGKLRSPSNVLRAAAALDLVDAAAAARLPPLLHGMAPRRAAGINGALPEFTAETPAATRHQPSLVEGVIPVGGCACDGRIVAHVTGGPCAFMRKQPVYSRLRDDQIVDVGMTRNVIV